MQCEKLLGVYNSCVRRKCLRVHTCTPENAGFTGVGWLHRAALEMMLATPRVLAVFPRTEQPRASQSKASARANTALAPHAQIQPCPHYLSRCRPSRHLPLTPTCAASPPARPPPHGRLCARRRTAATRSGRRLHSPALAFHAAAAWKDSSMGGKASHAVANSCRSSPLAAAARLPAPASSLLPPCRGRQERPSGGPFHA